MTKLDSALPSRILSRVCLVAAFLVMSSTMSSRAGTSLESELSQVMTASAKAWSAGKLDDFMTIYEDAADVTYVSGSRLVTGYAAIRAMYAQRFGSGQSGQLGALSFDVLATQALGANHALLTGRYHLKPATPGSAEVSGLFTLVFRKSQGQWRVISDHSS